MWFHAILAFLIAGLNDLDVLPGDVTNAYLNASCREKIWFEGSVKTCEDRGKVLIVARALYGLKSSGAAWRADLAATLRDMNFTSSQAIQMYGFGVPQHTMTWYLFMSMTF